MDFFKSSLSYICHLPVYFSIGSYRCTSFGIQWKILTIQFHVNSQHKRKWFENIVEGG